MKNKNFYLFQNFKYLVNSQQFKLTLLFLVINAIYGGIVIARLDVGYISTLLSSFIFPYFMMILLIIILLNTINTYYIFNSNFEYIIRLKTKKDYMVNLIKTTIFNNFVVYILQMVLLITILNLTHSSNLGLELLPIGVSNLVYLFFFFIRTFILISIITTFNVYLLRLFNKYIVLILNIIIYAGIPNGLSFFILKFGMIIFPTYIGDYFYMYPYDNFLLEVSSSLMFIVLAKVMIFCTSKIESYFSGKGKNYEIHTGQ